MNDTVTVTLDQEYIEKLGVWFTDDYGNPTDSRTSDYLDAIHQEVFEENLMAEMSSGWREKVELDVNEDAGASFTNYCAEMYIRDNIDLETTCDAIYPLLVPSLLKYKESHIKAIRKESPQDVRSNLTEYIIPLYEATDGFFEVDDIIEMLIDQFVDSVDPLGKHFVKPDAIADKIDDKILENRDSIDLENPYFYQGPEHLGILEHSEAQNIGSCIYVRDTGPMIPVCPSNEDAINKNTMRIIEELLERID